MTASYQSATECALARTLELNQAREKTLSGPVLGEHARRMDVEVAEWDKKVWMSNKHEMFSIR